MLFFLFHSQEKELKSVYIHPDYYNKKTITPYHDIAVAKIEKVDYTSAIRLV